MKLAKSVEVVRKSSESGRVLSKMYVDGNEFPFYLSPNGVVFSGSEQHPDFYEVTVTFLVDGPVTFSVVDRYSEL